MASGSQPASSSDVGPFGRTAPAFLLLPAIATETRLAGASICAPTRAWWWSYRETACCLRRPSRSARHRPAESRDKPTTPSELPRLLASGLTRPRMSPSTRMQGDAARDFQKPRCRARTSEGTFQRASQVVRLFSRREAITGASAIAAALGLGGCVTPKPKPKRVRGRSIPPFAVKRSTSPRESRGARSSSIRQSISFISWRTAAAPCVMASG